MSQMSQMSRLDKRYQETIRPQLMKDLSITNVCAAPKMDKVVVNIGVGEAAANIKLLDAAMNEVGAITGQRPVMRRAKKSIAAFKLREGQPVGACVTLRGTRMYEFIDRLFNIRINLSIITFIGTYWIIATPTLRSTHFTTYRSDDLADHLF